MKQIVQNLKTGQTTLTEVPVPKPSSGKVLIRTTRSLVSLGTERMLVEFGKAGWIQKARQQPDKVRLVLDKIKTEGLVPTVEAVFRKLDEPLPLGYCNVGVVQRTEDGGRRTEDRGRRTEDRGRRTEDGGRRTEDGGRRTEDGGRRTEVGSRRTEDGGQSKGNGDLEKQVSKFEIRNSKFKIGDRVASNGPHAEFVCVPENLCARVPDNVSDDEAAFTVVGAIALQGVRLCNPTFGETVVVIGLGLIGLLTCQFLIANGCRVIGIDIAPEKLRLAAGWGVTPVNAGQSDPVAAVMQATGGIGADGAIITASAKGDDIVHQAAQMSRKRGRIVLVGVVGLSLSRADFYEKELSFQVSCSYGPGRYDPAYEQKGLDYPVGFVRWTEQRNFEAVLHAIASGKIDVKPLITERVALDDYGQVYGNMGKSGAIASLLVYPEAGAGTPPARRVAVGAQQFAPGAGTIGIIGAGNFTRMTVLPALKQCGAPLGWISSAGGLSGTHLAKKYGIANSTTDYREMLADPSVALVIVTTRHHLHAPMVIEALKAGKHVFVEKPLCLSPGELEEIRGQRTEGGGRRAEDGGRRAEGGGLRTEDGGRRTEGGGLRTEDGGRRTEGGGRRTEGGGLRTEDGGRRAEGTSEISAAVIRPPSSVVGQLMVGFNRRFSPHIQALKKALGPDPGPMHLTATMNAGAVAADSWVQDLAVGGGRIIGEACHLLDLLAHLAGSPIAAVCMNALGPEPGPGTDNASILIRFANGSNGVVNYFANGHKGYAKERLEIFSRGRVAVVDNFRRTEAFGFAGFRGLKTRIDKGHAAQFRLLCERLRSGGEALIPFAEIENATRASFASIESLMSGGWVGI